MKPSGSVVVKRIGRLLLEDGWVEDGVVAIKDGVIEYAGRAEGFREDTYGSCYRELDAAHGLVVPGLVDCHTHLVFAGLRADEFEARCAGVPYEEIARRGGGIRRTVRAVRAASKEELVSLAIPRARRALAMGITTMEVKSGYGLTLEDEVKMLLAISDLDRATPVDIVPTFLGAHIVPPEVSDRAEYVEEIATKWIPAVSGLAKFCDVFCESIAFTVAESERILLAGMAAGLRPKVHAEQLTRSGGAKLAARISAVSADHLECADIDDIQALAQSNTIAVLLPGCAISLCHGRFPSARPFLDSGVRVAIATDYNPGSSMTQNLWLMGTFAMSRMGMTVDETWRAITSTAADAAGVGDRVGRLKKGFLGDLIILRVSDPIQPFYEYGVSHVFAVVKRGLTVVERREDGELHFYC